MNKLRILVSASIFNPSGSLQLHPGEDIVGLNAKKILKKIQFNGVYHITFNNDWIPSIMGVLLPIPFIWRPVSGQ